MAHSKANLRKARRLGITLPDTDVVAEPLWSSEGHDTVFDGKGKSERRIHRDVVTDTWSVSIGKRRYAEGISLATAMEVSHFLSVAQNRRAWKGLAPKERKAVVDEAEGLVTAKEALTKVLSRVNGGAVRISG